MAIKYYEKYPQRWESPSQDYPQGAFKNLSALGEQDGSYLEKDWLNDQSGFFGALLRNAEMTPNGLVDTAQKSQFYDALVTVAEKVVGEEGYRKLDNNEFEGFMQVRATDDNIGAGVILKDSSGKPKGQMTYNSGGLQFAQHHTDGSSQTFTLPKTEGELVVASQLDGKQDKLEFVGSGKVMKEGAYGVGLESSLAPIEFNGFYRYHSVPQDPSADGTFGVQMLTAANSFGQIGFRDFKVGEIVFRHRVGDKWASGNIATEAWVNQQGFIKSTPDIPAIDYGRTCALGAVQNTEQRAYSHDNRGNLLYDLMSFVPDNAIVCKVIMVSNKIVVQYRPIIRAGW